MNNKFFYGFCTALLLVGLLGCSSLLKSNEGILGKSSKTTTQVQQDIRSTENAQSQINEDRLAHIGAWSKGGVEYSLDRIPSTNRPPEVVVAKEMNERIEALAGQPDFKEVEAIKALVDKLLDENAKIKAEGEKALSKKDKEIVELQNGIKALNAHREDQISTLSGLASANAAKADQYKATLNDMDKWFGLGAIFYGLKKFLITSAWVLGIGSVLFLVLRVLSMSNPIAASIFAIFNRMGSWLINIISVIVPKATELAGHTATHVFNAYKSTLTKVVDAIQMAKERAVAAGKDPNLNDVLDEVAKSMNDDEKAIVAELKKALNWK